MKSIKNTPPRWAENFLSWYCKPELLEDLQGDLNEYFQRNAKSKGVVRAKLIYIIDVLKFMRLYTIRKPNAINILINWMMIGSYIRSTRRSLSNNKLFSVINIIGLAVSMSVGLLMITFLNDLISYDKFHAKGDRIYRIISHPYFPGESNVNEYASTSVKSGKLIREKLSGVEDLTIIRNGFSGEATANETTISLKALYADESFFKVFSFPLVAGSLDNALNEPYSLVITETTSRKLFGDKQALGQSVRLDTLDYVVTAVVRDVPFFSHIKFESLISFSTIELLLKDDKDLNSWTNIWDNYVYLTLPDATDHNLFQHNLAKLCDDENKSLNDTKVRLQLQPLHSIVLGKRLSRSMGPLLSEVSIGFPTSVVWLIGVLAFIVILSACFNYTNLSIARSLRRSKEVGIRKIIGAQRSHVLGQFLSESIIIALLALLISFLIFIVLKSQFITIAPELVRIVRLDVTIEVISAFILFAIMVGILAGLLPALFFSRIQAAQALRDISSIKVFKHIALRKVLIVVQYTFSLILITTTFIGLNQYKHFLSFDLGFNTKNVLNINLQGNKAELLAKELNAISEIEMVSQSMLITSVGNYWGGYMKYLDPQDSGLVWSNHIDEQYIPLHRYQLIAGRNISTRADSTSAEIIVSEKVLKRFGIGDPEKALGEIVTFSNFADRNEKLTIVGVMKDFHYGKMDNVVEPTIFRPLGKQASRFLNVKISTTDLQTTITKIDDAWKKVDKIHPLEATFYDEEIEMAYSELSALIKLIGLLAFLAISISSLGLFGMVVFTTETKMKEVSIRKALGASEGGLIYLLSRNFIFLLVTSAAIALPVTYFFFNQVLLRKFPYHAPIGIEAFYGFIIVMTLAFIMIGLQTLEIARTNPTQVLKNE